MNSTTVSDVEVFIHIKDMFFEMNALVGQVKPMMECPVRRERVFPMQSGCHDKAMAYLADDEGV